MLSPAGSNKAKTIHDKEKDDGISFSFSFSNDDADIMFCTVLPSYMLPIPHHEPSPFPAPLLCTAQMPQK